MHNVDKVPEHNISRPNAPSHSPFLTREFFFRYHQRPTFDHNPATPFNKKQIVMHVKYNAQAKAAQTPRLDRPLAQGRPSRIKPKRHFVSPHSMPMLF
jgi:hypothetical protein